MEGPWQIEARNSVANRLCAGILVLYMSYPFKPLRIFYVFISLYCRGLRGTYVFIVWNHIDAWPLLNQGGVQNYSRDRSPDLFLWYTGVLAGCRSGLRPRFCDQQFYRRARLVCR